MFETLVNRNLNYLNVVHYLVEGFHLKQKRKKFFWEKLNKHWKILI